MFDLALARLNGRFAGLGRAQQLGLADVAADAVQQTVGFASPRTRVGHAPVVGVTRHESGLGRVR